MKKITKILSVFLMVTVIVVSLTACGGSAAGNEVAGKTYVYEGFSSGDDEADELVGDLIAAMFESWTLSFNNNGKCTMKVDDESEDCDYEVKDGKVILKSAGETMEFTITDGKLVIDQEGVQITFKVK